MKDLVSFLFSFLSYVLKSQQTTLELNSCAIALLNFSFIKSSLEIKVHETLETFYYSTLRDCAKM